MDGISRQEFEKGIGKLHEKLDGMNTDIVKMKTILEVTPIPKQPCCYFMEHLDDHKSNIDSWKRPIIGGVIGACIAFIVYLIKSAIGKG